MTVGSALACGQVQGDVGDHVLLTADHLAPSHLDEDTSSVQVVTFGGDLCMTQETGVDPRITECEGLAIDSNLPVLERAYQVVRGVHQGEWVAPVLPTLEIGHCDEGLQRAIARPSALARQGSVHAHRA